MTLEQAERLGELLVKQEALQQRLKLTHLSSSTFGVISNASVMISSEIARLIGVVLKEERNREIG